MSPERHRQSVLGCASALVLMFAAGIATNLVAHEQLQAPAVLPNVLSAHINSKEELLLFETMLYAVKDARDVSCQCATSLFIDPRSAVHTSLRGRGVLLRVCN
jgi:hypothetical protein